MYLAIGGEGVVALRLSNRHDVPSGWTSIWATAFACEQGRIEVRHSCLKRYNMRCTLVKLDRKVPLFPFNSFHEIGLLGFLKVQEMVCNQNANAIQTCIIWSQQGTRQGNTPGYARIFLFGVPDVLKHLANEMHTWKAGWFAAGIKFDTKFQPPIISGGFTWGAANVGRPIFAPKCPQTS